MRGSAWRIRSIGSPGISQISAYTRNDISTSVAAISTSRMAVKRIIGSRLRLPIGDRQRRRVLVPGRPDAAQPFRQDEGIRTEKQRQRGKLLGIEVLCLGPQRRALAAIELDF